MRYLFHLSTLILLIANLFTIYEAWIENWNVFVVMLLYVIQGIIVGVLHYFKVLQLKDFTVDNFTKNFPVTINNKSIDFSSMDKETEKRKAARFFLAGYLTFHIAYLVILVIFILYFINNPGFGSNQTFSKIFSVYFLLAMLGFLFTHVVSFFLFRDEQNQHVNLGKFLYEPFTRVAPIHVTIIFTGFFMIVLRQQYIILFFFLGLKTILDVYLHIRQHEQHSLENTVPASQ